MEIETLVSALHYDKKNIKKANLRGKITIINQCNLEYYEKIENDQTSVSIFGYTDRGIGLSRKLALEKSSSEISLFSDDDIIYDVNYHEKILSAYSKLPDADAIFFNVRRFGDMRRPAFQNSKKIQKLTYFNSLKFGAVNITVKTKSIKSRGITFDKDFGVAPFKFGEDSIFIYDCLKSGLKIYFVNEFIGKVDLQESSWFTGYDKEFFYAKGAQFYRLTPKYYYLLMLQYLVRKRKLFSKEISYSQAFKMMKKGKDDYVRGKK